MASRIRSITIECHAAKPLAGFWAAAAGYRMATARKAGTAALSHPDGNGPDLLFLEVGEVAKSANQVVLDLVTADLDAEVDQLVGFGATKVSTGDQDGTGFAVMQDPEGTRFRVFAGG